jgi:lycopene beta-cyclase
VAQAAWSALWPRARLRNRSLYLFGLANLLRFNERQINDFFATFFGLPQSRWAGYLSDTLTPTEVLQTMLYLFHRAPNNVRGPLVSSVAPAGNLLWQGLVG